MRKAIWDKWSNDHDSAQLQAQTIPLHRTLNGENPSSGYRDMGSASLAVTRPGRDDNTPPARRAEG